MSRTYPPVTRGTRAYREVSSILGSRNRGWIVEESVTQISNRWLKADRFIADSDGDYLIEGGTVPTRRVRIRIPKGSYLTRSR